MKSNLKSMFDESVILALGLSPHGSASIIDTQVGELCRRFRKYKDGAAAAPGGAGRRKLDPKDGAARAASCWIWAIIEGVATAAGGPAAGPPLTPLLLPRQRPLPPRQTLAPPQPPKPSPDATRAAVARRGRLKGHEV